MALPVSAAQRSRVTHTLDVLNVDRSNPAFVSVTLRGALAAGVIPDGPTSWVKVFAPHLDSRTGRAYTIRRFHADQDELVVDIISRRQGGLLSDWIARDLQAGAQLGIAGPRECKAFKTDADWYLLLGDETALPAIASMLEAAQGRDLEAIVEVPFPDYTYVRSPRLRYLFRGREDNDKASYLLHAVNTVASRPGKGEIWIAGEAGMVKALRKHCGQLSAGREHSITATGYWKMGEQDYRDDEAFG